MAGNLWSCDRTLNKIYQHSGGTSSITTSFASPGSYPSGLTWDGTNLWSCDLGAHKIYQHSGGTSTITTSFASEGDNVAGLTWDGTNLWSVEYSNDKIYQHSGGTSTITTSFSTPSTVANGLTWDGTNLWSCDWVTDKIYQHSGGTSAITTSFSSPGTSPYGLAWDGTNLWSCDSGTNKIYQHSGGTSTITTSFASPGSYPSGLTWEEIIIVAPTVTTQAASSIEATTATGNGNITATGVENADHRGIVYGKVSKGDPGDTAPGDTDYDSFEDESGDFGTGAFTRSLTGLDEGTTYYARAYAHNSDGYSYGAEVSFLTKPAAPTSVAATENDGEKVVVTWSKATGATDYQIYRDSTPLGWLGDVATGDDTGGAAPVITPGTAVASDGTSTLHVVLSISSESIANGTTYAYKVRAKNATGESADSSTDNGYRAAQTVTYQWQRSAGDSDASYSNITGGTTDPYNDTGAPSNGDGRYFKCVLDATGAAQQTSTADRGYRDTVPATAPTVTTQAATAVADVTATGNGNITDDGGDSITQHGVCWKAGSDPVNIAGADDSTEEGAGSEGAFTSDIAGLSETTTYYYRAYATNSEGTSYGAAQSFETTATPVAPTVTTQAPTSITDTTATGNGNITATGGANATRRGFCYKVGESGDPTTANDVAYDDGDFGTGAYTKGITGLSAITTYRVRAYAVNAVGTSYGSTLQITTDTLVGPILTHATLLAGAETALSDCAEHTDLSRVTSLSLHVEMTFEASVDADPTVSIFASTENDDDEYDTSAWKTWTFTRSVGNTVTLHWPHGDEIRPLPKYIKTKVKNNSGAGANTSITSIKIKKVPLEL